MVSFDEEQAEAEALDRLQDLGLSQYEAQTLINLLRLGTGTTQDITRINSVPRTRVYEATNRLHELGFIDIQHTTPRKHRHPTHHATEIFGNIKGDDHPDAQR